MKLRVLIPFFLFVLHFSSAYSQDTLKITADSSSKVMMDDPSVARKRANRAALYSTVLPGAGQFYNKKYWKMPILYGGFIALGYGIAFNNKYYHTFKTAYKYRTDPDSTTI